MESSILFHVGPRESSIGSNLATVSPVTITIPTASRAITDTLVVTFTIRNAFNTNGSITPREGVTVDTVVTAAMRTSNVNTVILVAIAVTVVLDAFTAALTIKLTNTESILKKVRALVKASLTLKLNTVLREETVLISIDALTPRMKVRTAINPAITEGQETFRLVRGENKVTSDVSQRSAEVIFAAQHITVG